MFYEFLRLVWHLKIQERKPPRLVEKIKVISSLAPLNHDSDKEGSQIILREYVFDPLALWYGHCAHISILLEKREPLSEVEHHHSLPGMKKLKGSARQGSLRIKNTNAHTMWKRLFQGWRKFQLTCAMAFRTP